MSDFDEKKFPSAMKAHWKVLIDEIAKVKTEHARRRLKSKPDTSGFKGVRIKSDDSLISLGSVNARRCHCRHLARLHCNLPF